MTAERVGLIACTRRKLEGAHPARELYGASPLFRAARDYADRHYQRWYVLSAAYGVVSPDTPLPAYEATLARMSPADRRGWALGVLHALLTLEGLEPIYCFHAGRLYREPLATLLRRNGARVEAPLEGLQIGQQLAWYAGRRSGASEGVR